MIVVVVVGGMLVILLLAVLVSYNRFVSQRQYIANAWANVDTELRRRYDLIPNLVSTVKGYAAHERQTLENVIEARSRAAHSEGTPAEQAADENVLVGAVKQLLAVSEDYPDLKADRHFLELQDELVTTENRIQSARRFFNNNVRDFNRRVQSVPSNIVAKAFKFETADYFEIDEVAVSAAPRVQLDD